MTVRLRAELLAAELNIDKPAHVDLIEVALREVAVEACQVIEDHDRAFQWLRNHFNLSEEEACYLPPSKRNNADFQTEEAQ